MIDHTGVTVSNFAISREWYERALASIGYARLMEFSKEITGTVAVAGYGEAATKKPDFWVSEATIERPVRLPPSHIAFRANSKEAVDSFYKAALAAGGKDNGAPGPRPHYHANYYGAFVLDPDGNNIEAVFHEYEK